MKAGDDPRPDKQREANQHPNPPTNSEPKPAQGGVGTGTATDPAKQQPQRSTEPLKP